MARFTGDAVPCDMLGRSLEQVCHHAFLDELAIDGWRSQLGEVEIVPIKGHADYADAIEQPGNLYRRAGGSGRVGDFFQEAAIGISEVQRSIVARTGRQSDGLKGRTFSAACTIEDSRLGQGSAGSTRCEQEPIDV